MGYEKIIIKDKDSEMISKLNADEMLTVDFWKRVSRLETWDNIINNDAFTCAQKGNLSCLTTRDFDTLKYNGIKRTFYVTIEYGGTVLPKEFRITCEIKEAFHTDGFYDGYVKNREYIITVDKEDCWGWTDKETLYNEVPDMLRHVIDDVNCSDKLTNVYL